MPSAQPDDPVSTAQLDDLVPTVQLDDLVPAAQLDDLVPAARTDNFIPDDQPKGPVPDAQPASGHLFSNNLHGLLLDDKSTLDDLLSGDPPSSASDDLVPDVQPDGPMLDVQPASDDPLTNYQPDLSYCLPSTQDCSARAKCPPANGPESTRALYGLPAWPEIPLLFDVCLIWVPLAVCCSWEPKPAGPDILLVTGSCICHHGPGHGHGKLPNNGRVLSVPCHDPNVISTAPGALGDPGQGNQCLGEA